MIDFKQWIYSGDMADWFSQQDAFPVEAQMDCICAAPHRTLDEKLEGLRKLYIESGEKIVSDRMKDLGFLYCRSRQDVLEGTYLFQIEIFYQGNKEPGIPMIFQTAKQAAEEIKLHIEELSVECGLEREQYHGMIKVYHKADSADRFWHEENIVTRHDGEVLFALNLCYTQGGGKSLYTEMSDDRFPHWKIIWKIPYPSGTIVTVEKNPFFPSVKGVLVNTVEPDEAGFTGDRYSQWLLCAEPTYTERTHGIGVLNLLDDYVPFPCSVELELPYKQYISVYRGKLKDTETWLAELSELVQSDRSCLKTILHDRRPDSLHRMKQEKKRLAYVKELAGRDSGTSVRI